MATPVQPVVMEGPDGASNHAAATPAPAMAAPQFQSPLGRVEAPAQAAPSAAAVEQAFRTVEGLVTAQEFAQHAADPAALNTLLAERAAAQQATIAQQAEDAANFQRILANPSLSRLMAQEIDRQAGRSPSAPAGPVAPATTATPATAPSDILAQLQREVAELRRENAQMSNFMVFEHMSRKDPSFPELFPAVQKLTAQGTPLEVAYEHVKMQRTQQALAATKSTVPAPSAERQGVDVPHSGQTSGDPGLALRQQLDREGHRRSEDYYRAGLQRMLQQHGVKV